MTRTNCAPLSLGALAGTTPKITQEMENKYHTICGLVFGTVVSVPKNASTFGARKLAKKMKANSGASFFLPQILSRTWPQKWRHVFDSMFQKSRAVPTKIQQFGNLI